MILVTLKSLPHFKHSQPFSNKFTYRKLRQFYFSRKNYKKSSIRSFLESFDEFVDRLVVADQLLLRDEI